MVSRSWKRSEQKIGQLLGGRRVPVSGRGDGPDVAHPRLAVEVKARSSLPAWLTQAMIQAQRAAQPGQLPTVIIHEAGRPHREAWVCHRLIDYTEWYGSVFNAPDGEEA